MVIKNRDIECKVRRQTNYNICKCKVMLEILHYIFDLEIFKKSTSVHNILYNSDFVQTFKKEIIDLEIFINYLIEENPNKLLFLDKNRIEREFNTQRNTLEERMNYKNIKNELDLLKCMCTCLSHILSTLSWLVRFENLRDCNSVYYDEIYSPFIKYNNSISEYENKMFKVFKSLSKRKRILWTRNLKNRNKHNIAKDIE